MTSPANKTVLVTGAGGGFGRHMVQQFRAAGAKLLLTDISDSALAQAMDDAGSDLVGCVATNLATEKGCNALVEYCESSGITPDILVNNAGIAVAGRLDDVPANDWETLMHLNLLAPMRLSGLFVPAMVERGSGHIVNISSVAGWIGAQGLSAYCASKFGLRGFGESLAYDLHGTGVRVTNIYPSFARTPILDSPQYGFGEHRNVPEYLVSEPADVVRRMIKGIRRNKLHVFPDRHSPVIHYVTRFVPWLVPLIDRRLSAQSIKAGTQRD
jgi:NAD(P)-dependent dehydrogenase (short-subunit alcohol dehydrogenase family)